jgi:hypothetical protein
MEETAEAVSYDPETLPTHELVPACMLVRAGTLLLTHDLVPACMLVPIHELVPACMLVPIHELVQARIAIVMETLSLQIGTVDATRDTALMFIVSPLRWCFWQSTLKPISGANQRKLYRS